MSSYTEDAYSDEDSDAPLITVKQTQQIMHREPIQKVVSNQTQTLATTLMEHGISLSDVQKLQDAGYPTIMSIHMETIKNLKSVKGISDQKIQKIKDICLDLCGGQIFITADQCLREMSQILIISTGCQDFDNLLRGGFETQQICELFGEFRSGKSQICHTVAVLGQLARKRSDLPHQRLEYKVVFIDTEGTFRPDRIAQIAQYRKLEPKTVLSNIVVAKVHNHEQQIQIMKHIGTLLSKGNYSCLIIDSLTQFFRQDFQGRGELSERQQRLNTHLNQLSKLAKEYNLLVLITNQVQAVVDGSCMFGGESKRPIGGHVLAHASTMRLSLRKGRGEQRIVKIYDSPMLPESEAVFGITERGVDEYDI